MSTTSNPSDRDRQIDEIVAGYLEAEAKGQGPDRAKLLARHHAFAEELNGFFADHDAVKQMARPAPATLPPESSETDAAAAPTLSPTEHSPPVAQQSPGTKIR